MRAGGLLIGAILALATWLAPARAQTAPQSPPESAGGQGPGTPAEPAQPPSSQATPSIQSSLGPLGDPGGIRAALAAKGLTYSVIGIFETLGNASGGFRQGAIGEGAINLQLDLDLKTAAGLDGAALHANGFEIFGHGLTRNNIGNLSVTSGFEALPSTRLYEAWFEQKLFAGEAALRLGQLGADTEFITSQYAALFINSTFGWPNLTAYDLPSGGPAYPLATPGVRLKLAPDASWTLLAAVFDGDPAGAARFGAAADPQRLDPHGTLFRITDAPFTIAEVQYSYGDTAGALLPGTVKLGGFEHFGSFAASIPTAAGLTLGSGTGRLHGDDGLYGVIDQTLFRLPGQDDGAISAFARLSGAPGDRNLVSFYADGGLTAKGLIPGRGDDTAGVSAALSEISPAARRTDRSERALLGLPYPVRSYELVAEATYQAQIVPGFTLQPDVQYIVHPGGGIPDPTSPTFRPLRNAAVIGVRATIQY